MSAEYRYKAFISYRHDTEDIKVAEHLHNAIERYHIPKSIRNTIGFDGNMDIFRDKYDLPVTDSLNDTIAAALRESEYLIVICSTHLKESVWVEKEIDLFLETHPRENILTVLVDGEPNEVIPEILLCEETEEITEDGETVIIKKELEPLSADYRDGIKRSKKSELPRLVAGLLGCTYEDLMLRQQKYRTRMMASIGFGILCLALIASSYIFWSSRKINENYQRALFNQSESYAEESVRVCEEEENIELAIQLALSAVPQPDNDMPYNPHAHYALSHAINPYAYYPEKTFKGIHYYEGENGEEMADIKASEDNTYLAAVTKRIDLKQHLYLWNTKTGKLILKDLLDSDSYIDASLFFSKEYLWVILPRKIKIYTVLDGTLKKEIKPGSEDDTKYIKFHSNYLNNDRFYFVFKNEIQVYNINTLEMISKISQTEGFHPTDAVSFIVSPDDKYLALYYYENPYIIKLQVIDIQSQNILFEKKISMQGYLDITDLCFWHDNIIVACRDTTNLSESNHSKGVLTMSHDHIRNEVFSFNFKSGKSSWKTLSKDRLQRLGTNNYFKMQFRNLRILGTDQYAETVVLLDDDVIRFLNPATGEILQEEHLPCNQAYLNGSDIYEKQESINLFGPDENRLIELFLDDDDSTISFNIIYFSRQGMKVVHGGISDESIFACFKDEILHFKKVNGNQECTLLDKEYFHCEIMDWTASKDYLAVINTPYENAETYGINGELRLYDLKNNELYDSIPLDYSGYHILGIIDQRYLYLGSNNQFTMPLYQYDIKTKKMKELRLEGGDEEFTYHTLDGQIIDNRLVLLMEGYRKDKTEYYRAVYQVSDGTFSELSKGITRNSDCTTRIHNLSSSGSIAYIEVYEGEHAIVCLDTGKLLSLEDGIIGMCDNIQFNNRQVGLYDGEKLLVFDTEKEKPIVEINHLEIASFTLTDEFLYYLGIDSTLCRISLEDGSKKSVLLKKINKYADISLNVWDEYTKDHWFFDDDVIRVFISSSLSRDNIALEIDKDSLEMIGQDDTVLLYNEDSHCYYKTVGTSNPRSSQSKMKLAMIPCYSLDELIEKGKQLINNKELSEHKKMRYGIN